MTAVAAFVTFSVPLLGGLWNDDGVYLVLGRALATGHGYRALHLPGEPLHVKFPPGWPLVLAVFWGLTRSLSAVLTLARIWNVLALGATAGLLWSIGCNRWRLPPVLVATLALVPLLLDANLELAAIPTSEPTFLLLWALSLALWEPAMRSAGNGRPGRLAPLGFGLAVASTALVRGQGIVLMGAAVIAIGVTQWPRWARNEALGAMLLPVVMWIGFVYRAGLGLPVSDIPDDRPYTAYLIESMRAGGWHGIVDELSDHAAELWHSATYHTADSHFLATLILGGFLLCSAIGLIRTARRDPLFSLSVTGSMALLLIWPFAQFRLLLPIMPLLGLAAAVALTAPTARAPGWQRVGAGGFALTAMIIVLWRQPRVHDQGAKAAAFGRGLPAISPAYVLRGNARALTRTARWIERNTGRQDRLMTALPSAVFLLTGRQAVPTDPPGLGATGPSGDDYLLVRVRKDRLRWVIAADAGVVGRDGVRALAHRCPGLLQRVDSLEGAFVYAVDDSNACLTAT